MCVVNAPLISMLKVLSDPIVKQTIEYSAKRGLSPQIMKIELVSISATDSSRFYIL